MAVVIPFIAIAAGGAAVAGAVAAGVVTVAAIAGAAAIVSGVATLAGKPKIAKIAGIIGLGAGAYSLVAGAAGGASGAAGIDNMSAAAPGEAAGAIEGTLAADRAQSIETMTGTVGDTAAANSPSIAESATTPAPVTAPFEANYPGVVDAPPPSSMAPRSILSETLDPYGPPSSAMNGLAGPPSSAMTGLAGPPNLATTSPVQDTFLSSLKNVSKVLKDNDTLLKLGGGMLNGAFGPEAQKMSIYRQQLEFQKMLAERQNANANNLVGLRLPQVFNPNAPPLRRV